MSDLLDELDAWIDANWDPDLTVRAWWERLGLAGWAAPSLPAHAVGRDVSRNEAIAIAKRIAERGALNAPGGLGMLLAAPTISTHGTPDQIEQYVKPIVTGAHVWCQLFSEPGAGSDLAGLGTRAVRDGEEWIVNGQKVWTSSGHLSDMGMLIARPDPDVPKHNGLSWFAFDMHQPGVDVRPLREMTGRALFNEVFLSDARVPDRALVGGLHNGWAVANTTLAYERSGLGAGAGAPMAAAIAGTIAGDLDKRAGDF
ncbi:MAG: acyl-CoA dehydrogenase family protein, partial [Actinomycetes bacterium]